LKERIGLTPDLRWADVTGGKIRDRRWWGQRWWKGAGFQLGQESSRISTRERSLSIILDIRTGEGIYLGESVPRVLPVDRGRVFL